MALLSATCFPNGRPSFVSLFFKVTTTQLYHSFFQNPWLRGVSSPAVWSSSIVRIMFAKTLLFVFRRIRMFFMAYMDLSGGHAIHGHQPSRDRCPELAQCETAVGHLGVSQVSAGRRTAHVRHIPKSTSDALRVGASWLNSGRLRGWCTHPGWNPDIPCI